MITQVTHRLPMLSRCPDTATPRGPQEYFKYNYVSIQIVILQLNKFIKKKKRIQCGFVS